MRVALKTRPRRETFLSAVFPFNPCSDWAHSQELFFVLQAWQWHHDLRTIRDRTVLHINCYQISNQNHFLRLLYSKCIPLVFKSSAALLELAELIFCFPSKLTRRSTHNFRTFRTNIAMQRSIDAYLSRDALKGTYFDPSITFYLRTTA